MQKMQRKEKKEKQKPKIALKTKKTDNNQVLVRMWEN